MINKMTDEEVKQLALDIYKGLVFTDRSVQNPRDVLSVFMPLALMDKKSIKDMEDADGNPPGMIYEYMEKAGKLSINGMPTFFSFHILSQEDTKRVIRKYKEIAEHINKI